LDGTTGFGHVGGPSKLGEAKDEQNL